jgi:plasmid stabilization system protein ParE
MPEALEVLESIRKYLHENDAPRAAAKLIGQFRKSAENLANNPNLGIVEPLLAVYPNSYRSLIVRKRHKLIYYVEGETIYIDTIYDCRQQPSRLRRIFKKK